MKDESQLFANYEKMLADSLAQMHRIVELLEEIKEILINESR